MLKPVEVVHSCSEDGDSQVGSTNTEIEVDDEKRDEVEVGSKDLSRESQDDLSNVETGNQAMKRGGEEVKDDSAIKSKCSKLNDSFTLVLEESPKKVDCF